MQKTFEKKDQPIKQQNCPICSQMDLEQQLLIQKVYFAFKKLLLKNERILTKDDQNVKSNQFERLILIMNPKIGLINFLRCKHEKIIKSLINSLNCTYNVFLTLCEYLANEIGRKNYQLQVLAAQFKNTGYSIILEFDKKCNEKKEFQFKIHQSNSNKMQDVKQIEIQEQNEHIKCEKAFSSNKTLQNNTKSPNQVNFYTENNIIWGHYLFQMPRDATYIDLSYWQNYNFQY